VCHSAWLCVTLRLVLCDTQQHFAWLALCDTPPGCWEELFLSLRLGTVPDCE